MWLVKSCSETNSLMKFAIGNPNSIGKILDIVVYPMPKIWLRLLSSLASFSPYESFSVGVVCSHVSFDRLTCTSLGVVL